MNARIPAPGSPSGGLWFGLDVDFTPELTSDVDHIYVLVTVHARHSSRPGDVAEIIVLDRSRHMYRDGKFVRAQTAVRAAIGALPDETRFAVIAGNHDAVHVYPAAGGFARAGHRPRGDAMAAVSNLAADGGTALGRWLTYASELSHQAPPGFTCHAALYTNGVNDETPEQFAASLKECGDHFTCDVRYIGDDRNQDLLAAVTRALSGTAEPVPGQPASFARPLRQAGRTSTFLRLTVNRWCSVESVAQVEPPEPGDLPAPGPAGPAGPPDPAGGVTDFPLSPWTAGESRAYLVKLRVDRQELPDAERPAAWISMTAERETGGAIPCSGQVELTIRELPFRGPGPVDVSATRDLDWDRLTTAVEEGLRACRRGDEPAARRELDHAVDLARRLGAAGVLRRLERVVDIDEFGQVRLRGSAREADLVAASASARERHQAGAPSESALVTRTCPNGHETRGPEVNFCEEEGCRHPFPA